MGPGPLTAGVVGALLIAVSISLLRRRVKPNWLYGLRVPPTFADKWVWYEANAKSGRDLVVFGVLVALLGLVFPMVPGSDELSFEAILSIVLVVGALVVLVVGWTRASRLLRESRSKT
jgi:uncharacterized membrane protein